MKKSVKSPDAIVDAARLARKRGRSGDALQLLRRGHRDHPEALAIAAELVSVLAAVSQGAGKTTTTKKERLAKEILQVSAPALDSVDWKRARKKDSDALIVLSQHHADALHRSSTKREDWGRALGLLDRALVLDPMRQKGLPGFARARLLQKLDREEDLFAQIVLLERGEYDDWVPYSIRRARATSTATRSTRNARMLPASSRWSA